MPDQEETPRYLRDAKKAEAELETDSADEIVPKSYIERHPF